MHSQTEAVFHGVRAFHRSKLESPDGIRSIGAWNVYRYEAHRFAKYADEHALTSLLDSEAVCRLMSEYLGAVLSDYVARRRSLQTFETLMAALSKLEHAINVYIQRRKLECSMLDTADIRKEFHKRGRKLLPKSSRSFENRAYPDPHGLIAAIEDETYRLQAAIQYEGGLRAEGVGSPGNRMINRLDKKGLHGIEPDPVTGLSVGVVSATEKGGKETVHYISVETYKRLEQHIDVYGGLEGDYKQYLAAINKAARKTCQYEAGRGTHGMKHNFAQERYFECVEHGMTHEQAMQQTSLETSHFRLRETLSYTRGR